MGRWVDFMPKCETCGDVIDADQPFYLIQMVVPGEEVQKTYIGSMDCFVQWATERVAHFTIEHLVPDLMEADAAIEEAARLPKGGDPSLN